MAVQTTYNETPAKGFAGQLADTTEAVILSRLAEADIAYGLAMANGSADRTGVVVSGAGETFAGIAMYTSAQDARYGDVYKSGTMANVITRGPVWVEVTATVAGGEPAYVDIATGKFTNVSGGNLAVPNGEFEIGAASGDVALLRIK